MTIKSKSKTSTSKSKKSKPSKSTHSTSIKDAKIISEFEKQLIKDLYGFALKGKSKAEIVLAELEYPEEYKAKIKLLDKLKKQKIIKKYTLLVVKEEEFFPLKPRKPSKLEMEVNPQILLRQAPEDYMYYFSRNALIEFNRQKVINYYEKINRREIVEKGLKKEQLLKQLLICNGLKLGLESGNAIYGEAMPNFMPEGKEYKLLKALMEKPNKRLSYERSCRVVFGPKKWKPKVKNTEIKRKISFLIRNIKRKLKIIGKGAKNKDLFVGRNGYRIACDLTK